MKTIRNKTHAPVRVPLPRGKTLHLGVGQKGQIAHTDVDHPPLQKLVADGVIEIVDADTGAGAAHGSNKGAHAETHGHHPPVGSPVRGDR